MLQSLFMLLSKASLSPWTWDPISLVHSKKSLQWFSDSPLPSPHHRCFPLYWIVLVWTRACCCCSHLKKQHKRKNYLNFTLMIIYHSMSLLCSQTLLKGCLCYYLWSFSAFSLKSAPLWLSRSQRKPLKQFFSWWPVTFTWRSPVLVLLFLKLLAFDTVDHSYTSLGLRTSGLLVFFLLIGHSFSIIFAGSSPSTTSC